MDNLFFDPAQLKHLGSNVILGKTVRIRHPELVSIGDNTIIDDFTYISTAADIGSYCHIGPNCSLIGGPKGQLTMEDLTGCAPNCTLITSSDDYISGIGGPNVPAEFQGNQIFGKTHLKTLSALGAGVIVLPNITIDIGTTVAAGSVVRTNLSRWGVFGGDPIKKLCPRNRKAVLKRYEKLCTQLSLPSDNDAFVLPV